MIDKIKEIYVSVKEWILDSPTMLRWIILLGAFFALMLFAGFKIEEFKVTLLLLWYAVVTTIIASSMTYLYGKVNYHKAKTNPTFIIAQVAIFIGTYLFSGLVILGTYIAQFN